MKRSSIAKVMSVMLVVAIALSVTTITNAYAVSMNLSSSSELKAGNSVEVNLDLTNIDAGDGINGISGTLSYDSSIFEDVSDSDISSNTNWSITYNPAQNKIALYKNSKVNSNETVLTIKMKVKDTVNVSSTNVTLTSITATGGSVQSGGTGSISVEPASVSIKSVGAEITNPTNETTTDSGVPATLKVDSSDSTKASKNIPQTGDNYTIISLIAIVVAIAGITTVRYTILKRNIK